MNILMLLIFVGVALVALALVLFAWTVRSETFGQSDRLALMPLLDDAPAENHDESGVRVDDTSAGVALEASNGAEDAPFEAAEDAASPHPSTPIHGTSLE